MSAIVERVSKRSLDFANQRKAYLLRTVHGKSFEDIAAEVVNLGGEQPVWGTVRNICNGFSLKKGYRPYRYKNSGRQPWKLTLEIQKFVLKKLLGGRMSQVVTSTSLVEDVAREYGVVVEASSLRKLLAKKGYKWLPRSQKRKYDKAERKVRLRFAKAAIRLSKKALREKFCMSLDGVILSMPPTSETERFNSCWGGFAHVWRKSTEANTPI